MSTDHTSSARVLRILRFLASRAEPVSATRIADAVGIPRSSAYRLLVAMQTEGFVTHLPEERTYGLGPVAFEIGSAYLKQEPIARLGRPLLARLVERTGFGGHLVVLHGAEVLYIAEQRPPRGPALVTDVDVRLPAHLTASGRALLAQMPEAQIRALFPGASQFVDRTGVGPRSVPALMRILRPTRERGYAEEHGEVTEGLASVAAASVDRAGRPAASVALTFPDRIPIDRSVIDAVRRTARELTLRLGGPSDL